MGVRIILSCLLIVIFGCKDQIKPSLIKEQPSDSIILKNQYGTNFLQDKDTLSGGLFLIKMLQASIDIVGKDDTISCNEKFEYLGMLSDKNGNKYLVANYSIEWGSSCRLTTRLLVYSKEIKLIGSYYTDGVLPLHIYENQLDFDDGELVSFYDGIPDTLKLRDISFDLITPR